jgi:putative OPT family oligopeptide transporter
VPRTERDLPPTVVIGGIAALTVAFATLPVFRLSIVAAVLAVVLAFFFVVVSGRIVGLVGTTSQPVSGMTITALLITTFVLVALGERGPEAMAASIGAGAIVAIAIALAGDVAQDLKTGVLLGATPSSMQIGQMVGAAAAALRAGSVLFLLHAAYGLGSPELPAPQARLMATLVTGVVHGDLPWTLMLLGAALALAAEAAGVVSLAFAIGLYLPITTTAPLIFGGLLRAALERRAPLSEQSTLFASGLIAGDALMGIGIAVLIVTGVAQHIALRIPGPEGSLVETLLTVAPFAALAAVLAYEARRANG